MPPGEPHLLAGRIEGDREPGEHPVTGAERVVLQEENCLRVDKCRGRAVCDRDPLRHAGGSGGEDDPGVVIRGRAVGRLGVLRALHVPVLTRHIAAVTDDADGLCLPEDETGPLIGVVDIDRNVGSPGEHHGENRDVEFLRSGVDADTDPVPRSHARRAEHRCLRLDGVEQFGVAQRPRSVIDGGCLGMVLCCHPENVDERPGWRREGTASQGRLRITGEFHDVSQAHAGELLMTCTATTVPAAPPTTAHAATGRGRRRQPPPGTPESPPPVQ